MKDEKGIIGMIASGGFHKHLCLDGVEGQLE